MEGIADAIPWGTRTIDLNQYPLPNLVIEVSDTSLADNLGAKRFLHEELAIPEYWIVNVSAMRILAFAIAPIARFDIFATSRCYLA